MKTIYIIHGWDGSPDEPMHKWLKKSLEEKGYNVVVPEMPNPERPEISAWIGKIREVAQPNESTVFVGHSIGCQAVLRYLEQLPGETKVAGVILIAPWMKLDEQTVKEEGEEVAEVAKSWEETPIDFEKVKKHSDKFIAIFSDNDPYVPLSQKDLFEKELSAKIIVEHEKGHFTTDDGIDSLPSAFEAVLSFR